MNSFELASIIQRDEYAAPYFAGIFARDELPDKITLPSLFIINTHPHTLPGEHWVAVYMDTTVEHFDPLGRAPFLNSCYRKCGAKRVVYPQKTIQSPSADTCGIHCVLFLLYKARGKHLYNWLNEFYTCNTVMNDCLAMSELRQYLLEKRLTLSW